MYVSLLKRFYSTFVFGFPAYNLSMKIWFSFLILKIILLQYYMLIFKVWLYSVVQIGVVSLVKHLLINYKNETAF